VSREIRLSDLPPHYRDKVMAHYAALPARRVTATRAKSKESELEIHLATRIRQLRLPEPVTQHRFHPIRRWRFDFAWLDQRLAVEVDGGTYSAGRHVRASGFHGDAEKLNAATELGWRILRFDRDMVIDDTAVATIARVLGQ
jgi:very-short-patch-repair endonuclease